MSTTVEEKEDWEKKFDKRFTESSIDFQYKGDRDVVKWYITELLTSQKNEIREKIRGMKLDPSPADSYNNPDADVYNAVIDDILALLTDKEV